MQNLAELAHLQKSAVDVWKECLKIIKDNVPFITYNTWFLPIKPFDIENTILKVYVPNSFFIEWIEEHYNTLINKTIHQVLGSDGKLIYLILEEKEETAEPHKFDTTSKNQVIETENRQPDFENYLNVRYTFENFIKGEGNQLARAAAFAIGENPGQTSFNPLFIYGGVGLGKTHLIHAIGNKVLEKDKSKKVIYISADAFTVEFVESIQNDTVNEFSSFYKTMDCLIIDDIQFLIGKEKTQDLFFQIFNTLHQSGKQVVLSSDKAPKDLKGLNERLISRFSWGLSADIQPPDFETRIAILKNKSETFGIYLSNETLEYIAQNITSNIRELEGCLIKLLANSSLNSKEIDFELVKKTVKEISTNKQVNISVELITKIVCDFFGVEENKLREKNRRKEVVMARQIAMYLAKTLTKSSLKTIGLQFGGRDHSTVIHAQTTVEELIKKDMQAREVIETLKNKIEMTVN
ncbi:MAG: chromosomal replication initiator protein DnaA [Ignavibacteriales bacterium]|jgi:chromosomal replication initiator protein|nr:MAG: chromosomal replication initiator protein DnaA [Ignavibacteriales bacterium]